MPQLFSIFSKGKATIKVYYHVLNFSQFVMVLSLSVGTNGQEVKNIK